MSVNQNPDFWRSQETGGSKPPISEPKTSSSPLTDNMRASQSKARNSKGVGDSSTTPESNPPSDGAEGSYRKKPNPVAEGVAGPKLGNAGGPTAWDVTKKLGAGTASASAKKIVDKKANTPKKTSSDGKPPEVLSKETGKEAVKEGLKQGVKGAAKGAVQTKSLQGAAVAAGVGAAAGVADKINEAAAARKQAGTTQATRSSHGALAGAGGGALDRGRAALENKYGASIAAKSKLPVTKEQVVSIAKASATVNHEISRKVVKTTGIAVGTVMTVVYALVMTTVSATSGPIAAAISSYQVTSASCEAPDSSTPTSGNKGSEEGLKPAPIKALRYINATWGGEVQDVYGNRAGDPLDHGTGNALDVMIADYTAPASNALGHEIADYFQNNAKAYGIKYIIFDNQIWANGATPASSWTYGSTGRTYGPLEWAPYSILPGMPADDNQKHLNHVHISFNDNPGDGSTVTASASTTLTSPEFERASSIQVLNNVPVMTANLEDLNTNYAKYGLAPNASLRAEQIGHAKTIIGVAKNIGFNEKGAEIGVMTAMEESTLQNLDYGDAAGPNSRGLFQQRTVEGGWGSVEDVMNPAYAAQAFFLGVNGKSNPGLDSVSGWQDMEPWMAASAVQRSAYGGTKYAEHYEDAKALVSVLYAASPPVPAVTAGKINPPKSGVNVQTSENGCASSGGDGGDSATAAGDTYPARNEDYCRSAACYAIQSADRVANGYRGECVDWAGWKLLESTGTYGTHVPIGMGDAKDWGSSARAKGIAVDMTPRAGDAVYWAAGQGGSSGSGHIATVQSVSGNKVVIEEYNFAKSLPGDTPATGGGRYNTRTIDANSVTGYIHFIDPSKSKEENKEYLISKGILVPGKTKWPRATA